MHSNRTQTLGVCLLAILTTLAGATNLDLQPDALLNPSSVRFSPEVAGSAGDYSDDYNFAWRSLRLGLGAEAKLGWDDNVAATETDEESAGFIAPALKLKAYWPISPSIQLTSDLTLGYRTYSGGDAVDGFFVNAGTDGTAASVRGQILTSKTSVLVLDGSYSQTSQSQEFVNAGDFNRYMLRTGEVGVQYSADINHYLTGNVRYGHIMQRANNSAFEAVDLDRDTIDLGVMWQLQSNTQIGPYIGYESVYYDANLHNDSDEVELGLAFAHRRPAGFSLDGHVAFSNVDFSLTNALPRNNDYHGLDAELRATFMTTERLVHALGVSHGARQGLLRQFVNYARTTQFDYSIAYELASDLVVGGDAQFAHINESDDTSGEEADVYSFGMNARYLLSDASHVSINYMHAQKHSDQETRDFRRNVVEFTFGYKF